VVCTNPAVSLPELGKVKKALRKAFTVVQDAYWNDTCELANLILPACQLGEKEGTMTGSDRTITHSRKLWNPPSQAKPDWEVFTLLAERLGASELFPYTTAREIFEEFKRCTEGRLCDISKFSYEDLPKRWGSRWLYEELEFLTPSRKARFYPTNFEVPQETGSFILITGRLKNQWHTMTKTGKSPHLLKGEVPPFVLMNPKDAEEMGIAEWDKVLIRSKLGETERVVRFGNIKRGHLFSPFGYPKEFGKPVNHLISTKLDPFSGEPDLKFVGVDIVKIED
jgi:ferredoxin-nitrate reductase